MQHVSQESNKYLDPLNHAVRKDKKRNKNEKKKKKKKEDTDWTRLGTHNS
jgi:hypothetical protein